MPWKRIVQQIPSGRLFPTIEYMRTKQWPLHSQILAFSNLHRDASTDILERPLILQIPCPKNTFGLNDCRLFARANIPNNDFLRFSASCQLEFIISVEIISSGSSSTGLFLSISINFSIATIACLKSPISTETSSKFCHT